jgi:hypothetical protein
MLIKDVLGGSTKSIYHEKLAKDVVFHASCMSQRLMRVLRPDLISLDDPAYVD